MLQKNTFCQNGSVRMTVTVCAQVTRQTNWFSNFAEELLFRARNSMKRKVIRVPVPWYEYLPAVVMNLNPSLKANFMTKKSTFTFYSVMKICNYNVPLIPQFKKEKESCAAILPLFLAKKNHGRRKGYWKKMEPFFVELPPCAVVARTRRAF